MILTGVCFLSWPVVFVSSYLVDVNLKEFWGHLLWCRVGTLLNSCRQWFGVHSACWARGLRPALPASTALCSSDTGKFSRGNPVFVLSSWSSVPRIQLRRVSWAWGPSRHPVHPQARHWHGRSSYTEPDRLVVWVPFKDLDSQSPLLFRLLLFLFLYLFFKIHHSRWRSSVFTVFYFGEWGRR